MTVREPAFTIGIEEEYLLVDPETRNLIEDPPPAVLKDCERLVQEECGGVRPEFLRAQVEVGTAVCKTIKEARAKLADLRACVAMAVGRHGFKPIAASTHPFAEWQSQRHTDKERYHILARDLQGLADRLLICGMHVHIGIEDDELRIDLMNQVSYFLPHLLVLSTSSPFWRGRKTGLMCYRLSVFDELPRTGLPEKFDSYGEYRRHLDVLLGTGLIDDASKIWWDVRVHPTFPTVEMRISDICTRLDDGITVAALYLCVMSMLMRLRRTNQRWRIYSNMLVNENRWRAQRYGFDEGLVDFGRGEVVPYAELLEELIDLVREDAERLDCVTEIVNARDILARGTSAHRQLAVYDEALEAGADQEAAHKAVVDWLIEESMRGVA